MDGIIVLTAHNRALENGRERTEEIPRTCDNQMRPVLMTCNCRLRRVDASGAVERDRVASARTADAGSGRPAPVLILIILPLLIDLFSLRVPVVQEETEGAEPAE